MNESDAEILLRVASAYATLETDPEVARGLERVVARAGDLEMALSDLVGGQARYGRTSDFFRSLVNETFSALLGKDELIEQLEAHRKSVVGKAVTGIGVGVGIISGVTGLHVAVATLVFLYLVPVGVRAGYDAWKREQEPMS